jgi:Zn finger protein HypA/HybF involved in hydrogenase expression
MLPFSAHARGALAEGAKLEFRLIHVEARCRACTTKYAPDATGERAYADDEGG